MMPIGVHERSNGMRWAKAADVIGVKTIDILVLGLMRSSNNDESKCVGNGS